jgi:hypothetical protein
MRKCYHTFDFERGTNKPSKCIYCGLVAKEIEYDGSDMEAIYASRGY